VTSPAVPSEEAWFHRLRPQARASRRRVVVAFGVSIVLCAVAGSLPDAPLLTLLAIVAALGLGATLLEVPVAHLDDVMVRVRNEAKARAHTILVALMGALLVLAPFIARFARGPLRDDAAAAIIVPSSMAGALFLVAVLLPTWVLAWRLPDADEDGVVEVPDDDSTEVPERTDG
jgi:hypothetical protein